MLHSAPREVHEMGNGHMGTGMGYATKLQGAAAGASPASGKEVQWGGVGKAYAKRKWRSLAGARRREGSGEGQGRPRAACALWAPREGSVEWKRGPGRARDCVWLLNTSHSFYLKLSGLVHVH